MKTILAAAMLSLLLAAKAESQELVKAKVAVVRMNRLMNNELVGYETIRLLAADKESLRALSNVGAEIKTVQVQIVDAGDENALNELEKKLNFLNRKRNILMQRISNNSGRDVQKLMRDFVVANFRDKYHLIAQEPEAFDRFICKENAEITDITDDVAAKLKEHVGTAIGE